jgi:hypothetical protein
LTELAPGRYSVTVEAPSFSKALLEEIELNVGNRQTVNFDLKPGSVTETVEVTAEGNLIETTRSDLDTSITPKEIENLPLLNRTFAGLSVIAPEARPVGNFDPTKTRVGNIAFAAAMDGKLTLMLTAATIKIMWSEVFCKTFPTNQSRNFRFFSINGRLIKDARSAASSMSLRRAAPTACAVQPSLTIAEKNSARLISLISKPKLLILRIQNRISRVKSTEAVLEDRSSKIGHFTFLL